jgi:glycosyltransferase involved in cell wall biosynthesis
MQDNPNPTVSIIIKTLNEEQHVAAAIESALAALETVKGEVILADSASTDATLHIGQNYPIKIVRLDRIEDRSCGAGAQLGFQYSSGRYLCLMDGDMRLRPGFLPAAIHFLEANPAVAGVGGMIIECETENSEFSQRMRREDPDRLPGPVTRLDCSGVYRRAAIESIGYLTDRNLHAGEELDLGARLHARGWRLARIDVPAVDHHGHRGSGFRLLLRRVASRLSFGMGEVVRAAVGQRHFWFIVSKDRKVPLCLLVLCWWLALIIMPLFLRGTTAALAVAAIIVFPFAVMGLRWDSFYDGIYSVAAWNVFALSFMPGFLRPRVSPTRWIESTIVKEGPTGEMPRFPAAHLSAGVPARGEAFSLGFNLLSGPLPADARK